MFPAPSPNSQAFLQSLANGGTTPSTLDFHRTAINAAAANKNKQLAASASTSQDSKPIPAAAMDPLLQQQSTQDSTFGQHDSDAANGLFLLAQATNGQQANRYPPPPTNNQRPPIDASPETTHAAGRNGSLTGSAHGSGEFSDEGDSGRMATRSRGKRTSNGKSKTNAGRRKAEDTPSKQPPGKKQRSSNMHDEMDEDDSDDEEEDHNLKDENGDPRKMTDEEKRKNFLERNR